VVKSCEIEVDAQRGCGENPERTTYRILTRVGTGRHEAAARTARDDMDRASKGLRIRLDTEVVDWLAGMRLGDRLRASADCSTDSMPN
jgi:hypothetical protein